MYLGTSMNRRQSHMVILQHPFFMSGRLSNSPLHAPCPSPQFTPPPATLLRIQFGISSPHLKLLTSKMQISLLPSSLPFNLVNPQCRPLLPLRLSQRLPLTATSVRRLLHLSRKHKLLQARLSLFGSAPSHGHPRLLSSVPLTSTVYTTARMALVLCLSPLEKMVLFARSSESDRPTSTLRSFLLTDLLLCVDPLLLVLCFLG